MEIAVTLRSRSRPLIRIAIATALTLSTGRAKAGGGPENVFVVVNQRSWASKTIANHFALLRRIPDSNVFHHEWKGGSTFTHVDGFRDVILRPVLAEIDKRRLGGQIDYIVYSSDFPYEIRFNADVKTPSKLPASGSLTGLTYVAQLVQTKDPAKYARANNRYTRMPEPDERGIRSIGGTIKQPTRGFRSQYQWGPSGERVESGGLQFILSAMLAHTSGRGNSVSEAIRYLQRSALADGTHPDGSFYFMLAPNSDIRFQVELDVRSTARESAFPAAVQKLHELGVGAEILKKQVFPMRNPNVLGVMVGTRLHNWRSSGSTLLPGAICENLTSYGAVLDHARPKTQTSMTEFLRYGAAGTCGTVVEPSLNWTKFPLPMVFAHYARGCTLAESLYQSILNPHQQLIVGDPLCRPWAQIPIVTVEGVAAGDTVAGTMELRPDAQTVPGVDIDHFELFVDGQRIAQGPPGGTFSVDTRNLGDGYHELRIVAVDDTQIENQGRLILPLIFDNHGRKLGWQVSPERVVPWEQPIVISVNAPGANEIAVIHGRRVVGAIRGSQGDVRIDPKELGYGPVALQALGLSGTQADEKAIGTPIRLRIMPPRPMAALRRISQGSRLTPVQLNLRGKVLPIGSGTGVDWLAKAGVKLNERFQLSGHVQAPEEDMYQFELQYQGECQVRVNGTTIFNQAAKTYQHMYVPVALQAGAHRVEIHGRLTKIPKFYLAFGNQGTASIVDARYAPGP